jgi:hypothetical protein
MADNLGARIMVAITTLSLNKLKVYANWKKAPLGSILQTRTVDGAQIIGLRCELDLSVGRMARYFLVLEGDQRGALLEGNVIGLHAIDLSSLVEVGVCEISLTRFSGEVRGAIIGLVCEHGAGTGHFCVQARSSGYVRGFVWLSDPAKGKLEAEGLDDLRREMIVIGHTSTIEIKPTLRP